MNVGGGKMGSLRASAFVLAVIFFSATFISAADSSTSDTQVSEQALQTALRFERRRDEGDYISIGHGTAFGIDLARYGIPSHRYMLSAAHLVLKDGQLSYYDLRVEVGKPNSWAKCRLVAIDKAHDICLLECDRELDSLSKLSDADQKVGSKVLIAGSPLGVPICLSPGRLTNKEPNVERQVWQAEAKFNHGNSGGPVFEADTGKLIGVAVAGMQDPTGDMKENIALFTPAKLIKTFLYETVADMLLKNNKSFDGISER
jgi:S1-C subfamily serine protease